MSKNTKDSLPQKKLVSFKFDDETIILLEQLAKKLCGGNKTLAVKTAIVALDSMSFNEQHEITMRVNN